MKSLRVKGLEHFYAISSMEVVMPVVRTSNCPMLSLVMVVLHFLVFLLVGSGKSTGKATQWTPEDPFFWVMFPGSAKSWNVEFRRVTIEMAVEAK